MRLNTPPCKCLLISTLVLVVFLLAACEKELPEALPDGMLRISAEALTSGSKAVVDGVNSTWQDGDQIRFSNGTLATVTLNGNGNFYISSDGIASGTSAVYPASIVKEEAGVWTLTLPETYQYAVDGSGHQVIDMPMAAYYAGDGTVYFRHLTGGLYFTVTNNTGATVRLDRVTVENETHYMNGSTLALNDITTSFLSGDRVFAGMGGDAARKRVSLLFNDGLELTNGSSRQVLVPVPAFTVDAAFTITVYAHNGTVSRYLFDRTQSEHVGHITASQVGYANISLGDNVQGTPFEGNGTYASPFQIYTKEDYLRMVDSVNGARATTYRTKYYDIAANIDMGGATVDGLRDFAGVIDGKGHTISNVCFGNSNNGTDLGMISKTLTEARDTVRNLTLDYVSFTAGGINVGAFVGNGYVNRPWLALINCHLGHITYNTLAASASVGGLVGYIHNYNNSGSAQLNGCSIEQPLTLTMTQTSSCNILNFGGLVGAPALSTLPFGVTDCETNADITIDAPTARVTAGAVVGADGSTSTYTNVTVKAGTAITVTGRDIISVGALNGSGSGNATSFTNCTALSIAINGTTVYNGTSRIGGLLGQGTSSNARNYNNCTVSGSITLTKGSASASSYLGMVSGDGDARTHWVGTDRGNSASVTLTVTNDGSTNDHIGEIYGN